MHRPENSPGRGRFLLALSLSTATAVAVAAPLAFKAVNVEQVDVAPSEQIADSSTTLASDSSEDQGPSPSIGARSRPAKGGISPGDAGDLDTAKVKTPAPRSPKATVVSTTVAVLDPSDTVLDPYTDDGTDLSTTTSTTDLDSTSTTTTTLEGSTTESTEQGSPTTTTLDGGPELTVPNKS